MSTEHECGDDRVDAIIREVEALTLPEQMGDQLSWLERLPCTQEVIGSTPIFSTTSENSSAGRAQPCQGWGREFESRFSLKDKKG